MIIKPLGTEINTLNVANNIGSASLVRLVNTTATAQLVTIRNGGTTVATMTIAGNETLFLEKTPSHTIQSVATVLAVAVAFAN